MRTFNLPRKSFTPRSVKWSLRFLSFCVFALLWELAARTLGSLLMPTFTETVVALVRLLATQALWDALWISNQAMVLGFALSVLVGVPAGFAMARWRAAEQFINPYLSILLVTPMSALIPIMIMATGLGIVTRVLIVFSFAVVVLVVNTRAGLRTVDPTWTEMARSFGANEWQLWSKILLRGAFPAILTGLRLGMARAISGMLFVELLLLALGLGRLILDFQGSFDSANLYATVLVIVCEAVALMQVFKWLEHRAAPWIGQVVVE
jgi:ABC-type nitrate/sulfonate/bicarbonate transport system permease component